MAPGTGSGTSWAGCAVARRRHDHALAEGRAVNDRPSGRSSPSSSEVTRSSIVVSSWTCCRDTRSYSSSTPVRASPGTSSLAHGRFAESLMRRRSPSPSVGCGAGRCLCTRPFCTRWCFCSITGSGYPTGTPGAITTATSVTPPSSLDWSVPVAIRDWVTPTRYSVNGPWRRLLPFDPIRPSSVGSQSHDRAESLELDQRISAACQRGVSRLARGAALAGGPWVAWAERRPRRHDTGGRRTRYAPARRCHAAGTAGWLRPPGSSSATVLSRNSKSSRP